MDTSEVREGAADELKAAIGELVEFIAANEPQLLAYNVYLSDGESRMTVVHLHADPASLDHHMAVAGPAFRRFTELVRLTSIHVYGEPSEGALRQLHEKASLLGSGAVRTSRRGTPDSAASHPPERGAAASTGPLVPRGGAGGRMES